MATKAGNQRNLPDKIHRLEKALISAEMHKQFAPLLGEVGLPDYFWVPYQGLRLRCVVKGLQYYNGRKTVVLGDELWLEREPKNEVDSNAIIAKNQHGQQVCCDLDVIWSKSHDLIVVAICG